MGIQYSKSKIHWNYFLTIEKDFENLSRYIEFTEDNNNTYSIELVRLIMAATQEVDVLMKKICHLYDINANNINEYREAIKDKIPDFIQETVYINRFGMNSRPWINWSEEASNPDWWKANNNIKHRRSEYYSDANLKNAFNAIGALLITIFYFYKKEIEIENHIPIDMIEVPRVLQPQSNLFSLREDYYRGLYWGKMEW